jgi:hypothetical protein
VDVGYSIVIKLNKYLLTAQQKCILCSVDANTNKRPTAQTTTTIKGPSHLFRGSGFIYILILQKGFLNRPSRVPLLVSGLS